jgi:hypothetical protein
MTYRLKTTEVKVIRERQLAAQGNRCALCGLPLTALNARLDHDHSTGAIRGTLHNGCNAVLGKVENSMGRFGLKDVAAFGAGLGAYLRTHSINITGYLHPTHKSEDEKRVATNARRRKARAKKD